jgi:23S rRNA (adenine2503-C2)-methyltransferase
MSDLPARVREDCASHWRIGSAFCAAVQRSTDGTEKFLMRMSDNAAVEAVSIPALPRVTGCISSQVGCKYACTFCASGSAGFVRDLTVAEIMSQVWHLRFRSAARALTHVVFMGTGEPFDNYEAMMAAIRLMNDPLAMAIGARRITVSTCGLVPGIERFAREGLQVELSVSLHAADEATRSALMPVNKRYPLAALRATCKAYAAATRRQVTFEYLLIRGLNTNLQNARALRTIVKDIGLCKVNLIPANPVPQRKIEAPTPQEVRSFKLALAEGGVAVTVRTPRGKDIDAACGQLRLRHENRT